MLESTDVGKYERWKVLKLKAATLAQNHKGLEQDCYPYGHSLQ